VISEWVLLDGGVLALPKNSAHQEMRPPVFQPALAGFAFIATELGSAVWSRVYRVRCLFCCWGAKF
jgi:hypothetical protein